MMNDWLRRRVSWSVMARPKASALLPVASEVMKRTTLFG